MFALLVNNLNFKIGYDHHCPWTSKCIGKGNLKGFYAFVTSTMFLFGYYVFSLSMVNLD